MTTLTTQFKELDAYLKTETHRDNHSDIEPLKKNQAGPPTLPQSKPVDSTDELNSFWKTLRSFYRTGQGGGLSSDLTPILLNKYRDMRHVRYDYPVWIGKAGGSAVRVLKPLTELLSDAAKSTFPGDGEARILKDNLSRLELLIRERVHPMDQPLDFVSTMGSATKQLFDHLKIKGQEREGCAADLKKFSQALPDNGLLITLGKKSLFHLISASFEAHRDAIHGAAREEVARLRSKLRDLLRIEYEKRPEAIKPETLKGSYGYGSSFINFDKFSGVLPESPTLAMEPRRLQRIEEVVRVLDRPDVEFRATVVIGRDIASGQGWNWDDLLPGCRIIEAENGNLCRRAQEAFDDTMKEMAARIAALRIARLEEKGLYEANVHDAYFAEFDWQAFSEDEFAQCPPVVVIAAVENMMTGELGDFSTMLASHKPIKTLVIKQDSRVDYRLAGSERKFVFQQEIGALAVSHRNTSVVQAAIIHPTRLFDGLLRGFSAHAPSVFYVLTPSSAAELYVWTGAAYEGRLFPEFTYDQKRGSQWGCRFDVSDNPQVDRDWPVYECPFNDERGESQVMQLPFTLADFAAQDPLLSGQFLPVPSRYWTDDLVLFSEYLNLPATEAYTKLPFIWMVDAANEMQKVVTTHFMALFGQERLDFWHFVQEFGGVNSYHVQRAVEKNKAEMMVQKAEEMAALQATHEARIEEVRRTTAAEAMEKLSAILLDLDTLTTTPSVKAAKPTAIVEAGAPVAEPVAASVPQVEEEAVISTEPWLETLRCTSCNECININPNCFKYDANKQATIVDTKAATYLQMVTAAEKCPAKCIHPGLPLNNNEAGLEDLIKRASVFN